MVLPSPTPEASKPRGIDVGALSETVVLVVVGIILYFLHLESAAAVSILLGPALSANRYLLTKKIEAELQEVRTLAEIVDLHQSVELEKLQELVRVYLEITEDEFRPVKNRILEESAGHLKKLARQKASDLLATGEYYAWLLPMLEHAIPGSRIWAVSMMLDIEWDDSPQEERFLSLNIAAAQRGVLLERIFIVGEDKLTQMLQNKGVEAHIQNAGPSLRPHLVIREHLVRYDSRLLQDLGDGFIAFDDRVALIDVSTPTGMRGYVTMSPNDLQRWKRMFEQLRVHARELTTSALPPAPSALALPRPKTP